MMDRIVYGISAINFERKSESEANENCSPNRLSVDTSTADFDSTAMVDALHKPVDLNSFALARVNDLPNNNQRCSGRSTALNAGIDESEFDNDDVLNNSGPCSSGDTTHMLNSRKLPSRACKESNMLHKTKRRSIMKPKRLVSVTGDLRPAEIRKIYLNKKLGNFHPSKLETIFEDPLPAGSDDGSGVCLIGTRKLKRSLSCCDGLNINKTLIKQRRLKIKKTFGKRFALKKILLEDFMERLNRSLEDDPESVEQEMVIDQLFPSIPHEDILLKSESTVDDDGMLSKTAEADLYTKLS